MYLICVKYKFIWASTMIVILSSSISVPKKRVFSYGSHLEPLPLLSSWSSFERWYLLPLCTTQSRFQDFTPAGTAVEGPKSNTAPEAWTAWFGWRKGASVSLSGNTFLHPRNVTVHREGSILPPLLLLPSYLIAWHYYLHLLISILINWVLVLIVDWTWIPLLLNKGTWQA